MKIDNSESRVSAMHYLVSRYSKWPVGIVTEQRPMTGRIWGRWRWVLSIDGEVMFGNGVDPAITLFEFRYAQGNREKYNVH